MTQVANHPETVVPVPLKAPLQLLYITEVLDTESCHLGVACQWLLEFARKTDRVTAISCFTHRFEAPANVEIFAAEKKRNYVARGTGTLRRLKQLLRLFLCISKILIKKRPDAIFVHMNPLFVLLAAPLAKLYRIPLVLWYARGNVYGQLRFAHWLCDAVITASEESCRLPSPKRIIVGHGIDTKLFQPKPSAPRTRHIVSVGRIAPIKRCEFLIRSLAELKKKKHFADVHLIFAGDIVYAIDAPYRAQLNHLVHELGIQESVEFRGRLEQEQIVPLLQDCGVLVNATNPGSIDKAVLEAMACARPVLTTNTAFRKLFGPYEDLLFVDREDPFLFASKLEKILGETESVRQECGVALRKIVCDNHSLDGFADKVLDLCRHFLSK